MSLIPYKTCPYGTWFNLQRSICRPLFRPTKAWHKQIKLSLSNLIERNQPPPMIGPRFTISGFIIWGRGLLFGQDFQKSGEKSTKKSLNSLLRPLFFFLISWGVFFFFWKMDALSGMHSTPIFITFKFLQ